MAEDIAIRAEGVGKKYVIGHQAERESYVNLRDIMARSVRDFGRTSLNALRGRPIAVGDTTEAFWALKDVNFEVRRGEVVGFVGRNGAGKSTLLKVLSRITEPTEGRVSIAGRVASLLEVGTGFHPELTGRENIYLNGAILGMKRAEIRRKFDEIVAFSEVEQFLDTPVKRYSSGMYVRLAFAVAAHLEPEILIVDEVLAVGDLEFQKKCLGKMSEVAGGGRTVLFVSHNMAAVQRLCTKAIVMDHGRVVSDSGDVVGAIRAYITASAGKLSDHWERSDASYDTDLVVLHAFRALAGKGRDGGDADDEHVTLEISASVLKTDPSLALAVSVYAKDGVRVFSSSNYDIYSPEAVPLPTGRLTFNVDLPTGLLNEGEYEVELVVMRHNQEFIIPPGQGPRIKFQKDMKYSSPFWDRAREGVMAPKLAWTIESSKHHDSCLSMRRLER